ncbi:hypothetical protein KCP76_09315 [Salmonella enterica subsp. enterica serovar Weltevreden]|nr:hypothetical protein KCP76_09315 [Salmonella enterica subsp. enterica serovar Weltevreden]
MNRFHAFEDATLLTTAPSLAQWSSTCGGGRRQCAVGSGSFTRFQNPAGANRAGFLFDTFRNTSAPE